MVLGFSFFFVRLNHFSEYVFIGLLVIWIIQNLKYREFQWVRTPLDFPILVYLVWILFTVPFAFDSDYSFNEWRKALPRFLLFWFVVNVVRSRRDVRSILFSCSVGVGLLSFVETVNFFMEGGRFFNLSIRAGSFTGSSQWLSNYLVLGLPLVVLGLIFETNLRIRICYSIVLIIALVCSVVVHTRAFWFACAVQVLVYLAIKTTRRGIVAVGVTLVTLALFFSVMVIQGNVMKTYSGERVVDSNSMETRFRTWAFSLEVVKENPLVGIGYGKDSLKKTYANLSSELHDSIHNSFLSKVVQVGVFGGVLFLWMFLTVLRKTFEGYSRFKGQYLGALSLMMLIAVLGLVVRNLFDDMFVGTIVYLFSLLVGVFFALYRNAQPLQKTDLEN